MLDIRTGLVERGGSVVVINVWAITVDMFGNVVKGKINVDHISQEHITPATTTTTTPSHIQHTTRSIQISSN